MKLKSTAKKDTKLLWRIHHWAGLYCGILIAVLSLTGALAVFIPEIDLFIQKQYYSVSSSHSNELRIGNSIATAQKQYPDMRGLIIDLPDMPGQVAGLNFFVGGDKKLELQRFYFFVDAGKDEIVGTRNQQNSLANYMRQMHVRLYEGYWGRQLVGLGGIALLIVVLTGILIYGNFMKRQPFPKIRKEKGLRILMADWHKILGISALAFNLIIAITGAWLGLQPKIMSWFNIKTPNNFKAEIVTSPELDKQTSIHWNSLLSTAKKEFPDLVPNGIRSSEDGSSSIAFYGDIEGQAYERNANVLVLSKSDLKPIYKYDIREAPFSHKFYFIQESLHFGDFGGLGLKIFYFILGLTSAFLSISGFVVYLSRVNMKQTKRLSPLKTTFIYCISVVLILLVLALISLFIGYNQAALIAAFIVNGTLFGFILYTLSKYLWKKLNLSA